MLVLRVFGIPFIKCYLLIKNDSIYLNSSADLYGYWLPLVSSDLFLRFDLLILKYSQKLIQFEALAKMSVLRLL